MSTNGEERRHVNEIAGMFAFFDPSTPQAVNNEIKSGKEEEEDDDDEE